MKDLESVVDKLGKEKADLEKVRAAESLKHTEEMNRLRKSRKYEVTHERIRVMIAMIAKAEKRFHRISLREDQRDKYDDARYDTALKRAKEQIREGEEARKKAEEALRAAVRDKSDAIAREKALRKAFD
ncbi:hypothetical protein DY000_02030774 [Brassica cretica]|uniref:Remorin C-terminal domain-containing protein n=1 Tax=Brassica cretica TaxID=69181 RepID=A0ABQ7DU11_BRACR|nr:hypothetical protein DY000_02030774 [Brassica cretica]